MSDSYTTTLIQRLRTDGQWHRRRCNDTIALDCEQAADAIEQQAAEIAKLKQHSLAAMHDADACLNSAAEIAALRADAERLIAAMREVLDFQSAPTAPTIWDWGRWRRTTDDLALRQEQPAGKGEK